MAMSPSTFKLCRHFEKDMATVESLGLNVIRREAAVNAHMFPSLSPKSCTTLSKVGALAAIYQKHVEKAANFFTPKCEVRPSGLSGAGMGVFATTQIPAGEIITLYPAHTWVWSEAEGTVGYGPRCDVRYRMSMPNTYGGIAEIAGDPAKTADPLLLGHMLNDGFKCAGPTAAQVDLYYKLAERKCNVTFDSPGRIVYVVATRDIAQDEELFVPYGAAYWINLM